MDFKAHISLIVGSLVLIKLLAVGLSFPDAMGAFFIFISIHAQAWLNYSIPKRPDLFKEVSEIKENLYRLDEIERDLTALKLGQVRR